MEKFLLILFLIMVKIGIVQMKTCENKETNIDKAKIGIEECVKKGAEIVILQKFSTHHMTQKNFVNIQNQKKVKHGLFFQVLPKKTK